MVSCSNDENSETDKVNKIVNKGEYVFNSKTKTSVLKSDAGNLTLDSLNFEYEVKQVFICDETMPEFSSEEEMKEYISKDPMKASGLYELYINDELAYKSKIEDGVKVSSEILATSENAYEKYKCSYEGIRKCAVDRIDDMNWLDTWSCIAEGLNCVLYQMASCAIDIC